MKGYLRKRGKKYYATVYITGPDGKAIKKEISTGKEKEKEAQKVLNQILYEIQSNSFSIPNNLTLEQYFKRWLDTIQIASTTLSGYKAILNKHIIPSMGNIPLQKLATLTIQDYYNVKIKELSAQTVLHHHRLLHNALKQAVKLQIIPKNPVENATPPKVKKYSSKVLDKAGVVNLLKACKGSDLEAPITLAVILGLRRGEVLGLRWTDIDFENECLTINQVLARPETENIFKEPKSDTSNRTLALNKSLVTLLKKEKKRQAEHRLQLGPYYQDNDLVVCNEIGEPIVPSTLSYRFKSFLKQHTLPHVRFHDLRHTNATLMLKSGIAPKVASSRLGHSTIGITMDLYTHVLSDMEKDVADKLEELIYK